MQQNKTKKLYSFYAGFNGGTKRRNNVTKKICKFPSNQHSTGNKMWSLNPNSALNHLLLPQYLPPEARNVSNVFHSAVQ